MTCHLPVKLIMDQGHNAFKNASNEHRHFNLYILSFLDCDRPSAIWSLSKLWLLIWCKCLTIASTYIMIWYRFTVCCKLMLPTSIICIYNVLCETIEDWLFSPPLFLCHSIKLLVRWKIVIHFSAGEIYLCLWNQRSSLSVCLLLPAACNYILIVGSICFS